MTRVLNLKTDNPSPAAIYVGRPMPRGLRSEGFGNPFRIGVHGNRDEVLRKYAVWFFAPLQKALRDRVRRELADRDLVCWCAPSPCHADLLSAWANEDLVPEWAIWPRLKQLERELNARLELLVEPEVLERLKRMEETFVLGTEDPDGSEG